MIDTTAPNPRLLDRLAIIVGLFGERGHAEIAVKEDDGRIQIRAASDEIDAKVRYARKILAEYGRKPMMP